MLVIILIFIIETNKKKTTLKCHQHSNFYQSNCMKYLVHFSPEKVLQQYY